MTNNNASRGFTLIELLLAMSFIAFLLLFMVSAILQVTKLYVKGSAIRQINQTGRQVMDDLGSTLRSSTADPNYIAASNRLCVGDTSYVWNVENASNPVDNRFDTEGLTGPTALRFVSVQDSGGTLCKTPTSKVQKEKSTDLIGTDITPLKFSVERQGKLWSVLLVLTTSGSNMAAPDASTPTGFSCGSDNQFCAFGDFETSIYSRGTN